ncbi:uncharacterized protein LOC110220736 isoform X2 [Phascolarctos cinereus]
MRGSPGAEGEGGRRWSGIASLLFPFTFPAPPPPSLPPPPPLLPPRQWKKKNCARWAPAIYSCRRRRAHVTEPRAADGPLTLLAGEAVAAAGLRVGRRRLQWGFCLREKGNPGLLPFPDGGDLFVRTRERDPHIWRTSGDAAARGSAAAAAAAAAAEEEETTEHRGGWEALAGCLSPPAGGGACEDFRDS